MANKLIKNVDEEIWRKFTGYCKAKGGKVGEKLSEILENYLKNKIN
tara:strand:- start:8362 stop:8499 length:138 start_codon:yes stop_codon:yes gene_type:complete